MYEKLEECPSCKHTKFYNHLICKDHTVSKESFALMKCEKCGLIITNPRPDLGHISKYYEDVNYISHTNQANNPINLAYKLVRRITLNQKLNLIKKYTSGKDILDFGCGSGVFLNHMKLNKYNITGLETHQQTANAARTLTNTTIYEELNQIERSAFDIVTAWHVIEHVHDLSLTIRTLRKSLKKNGYIFIALPNHNSYDAQQYKEYWAAYDVPKHLYHFDKMSIDILSKKHKLKIVDVHPMKFDAYYVSLLSEQNKHGKMRVLNAFRTANNSNQKAKQTGEYSSLIYVLTA